MKPSEAQTLTAETVFKTLEMSSLVQTPQYFFIDDTWHLLNTKQLVDKIHEAQAQNTELSNLKSEESMYDSTELLNSCVKTITAKPS